MKTTPTELSEYIIILPRGSVWLQFSWFITCSDTSFVTEKEKKLQRVKYIFFQLTLLCGFYNFGKTCVFLL